ncbi:hypothetical protein PM082_023643 [Marasmius tenuissimus]|nr:hypothetical protein PM082_023643 [Marasmius tenuissimus]
MAQTPNFGDTISSGIQNIAALLPLLSTEQCEQCERHVGDALQKGYVYAAATPLSNFGALGVVKASLAILFATKTKPFYWGSWLHHAGFITTGSVASMVTYVPGTKQYSVEVQLELMNEQHIDNPEMISSIEWFGWKNTEKVGGGFLVHIFLVLQRQIYYITLSSLFLMKESHGYPLSIENAIQEQDIRLEVHLLCSQSSK